MLIVVAIVALAGCDDSLSAPPLDSGTADATVTPDATRRDSALPGDGSSRLDSTVAVDAEVDAAEVDAAEVDAAEVDAAEVDAAEVDAAEVDAACSDGDNDTICDGVDQCPGEDDRVDVDSNATADCVENMLENGQFASAVSSWTVSGVAEQVDWNAADADGSANSGSAQVTNASTNMNGNVNGANQCVQVSGSTQYTIWTRFYIPSGQAVTPSAGFGIFGYTNTTCTGSTTAGIYSSTNADSPLDAWTLKSHTFTTQAGAQSLRIRLNVTKSGTASPLSIRYDNVLMRQ